MIDENPAFKRLAELIQTSNKKYKINPKNKKEFDLQQKKQAEKLFKLERSFKAELIKHGWGPSSFRCFISFICDEKRNILRARPYFRERKEQFQAGVVPALVNREWRGLLKFQINYPFINFIMGTKKWGQKSKIREIFNQIVEARNELIITNLPLAISRARMFWSKAPKAQLSFMDFIQLAVEGLMVGIDKYEPPYTDVFRSVAIQRMSGNFIEASTKSSMQLHFFPIDRRKIYNARKFLCRNTEGEYTEQELIDFVNRDLPVNKKTNEQEISGLISASSVSSYDVKIPGEKSLMSGISQMTIPEEQRPDISYENQEAISKIYKNLEHLPLINQKLLRMKGIRI